MFNRGKLNSTLFKTSLIGVVFFISLIFAVPSFAAQLPEVTSPTHPDPSQWYANSNPNFVWNLPADVSAVSYLITDKPTSNPGPNSDGLTDHASFTSVAQGTQYFHIKFKEHGVWGPIAHYQFNVDTTPPADLLIRATTASRDIQPAISFTASDDLSGMDHYEVKIGENGSWIILPVSEAGKSYRLAFNRIGTQDVYVKAVDKAGNAAVDYLPISITAAMIASTAGSWAVLIFNSLVDILSRSLLIILGVAAFFGLLLLLFELLLKGSERLLNKQPAQYKKSNNSRRNQANRTSAKIIRGLEKELAALNKRRQMGAGDIIIQNKLQQYIKDLKGR